MKWMLLVVALAIPLAVVSLSGASSSSRPAPALPASADLVAKGRYLATAADCVACHTAPGGKAFAGGLTFQLPFGTMYSTNITPDRSTGIGNYSDDEFVAALRRGVRRDGQHLYPSMPYTSFTGMSRDDVLAIKTFLFSLPVVNRPARPPSFGFPFNQRWALTIWNAVFFKDRRFQPNPSWSLQQNRGAYLATALGHCGECHTPRNLAFAVRTGCQYCGAELQGWRAFNLTTNRKAGLGGWSDQALAQYISTGRADGHGAASGPMAEAVSDSLQYWSPNDVRAMVAYLRTVADQPGIPDMDAEAAPRAMTASAPWAPANLSSGLGQHVFEASCASCHAWNGGAPTSAYAGLAGARAVSDRGGLNVVQAVLKGVDTKIDSQRVYMPAFGQGLTDAEVAAVSNFVLRHFGGVDGAITPDQVRTVRTKG